MDKFLIKGRVDQFFVNNFEEVIGGEFSAGRKLFVLKETKKKFDGFVADRKKDFNALYFYNQILSLKNMGYLSSQFSRISPILKRLKIEGGEVLYAVWNSNVYVTQVNVLPANAKNVPAGVYKVSLEAAARDYWAVEASGEDLVMRNGIDTSNLAINGFAIDIQGAANYMPGFIRYGFGEKSLAKVYSLFYNPSSSPNDSDWRSLRDTLGFTTQTAKKLSDVLILTSKKNQHLNITVHENGHALLMESLKLVSDKNIQLDQFTVFYANPTKNTQIMDVWRKRVGMRLADKPPLVNPLSAQQNILTGNFISQPIVGCRAQPQNKKSILYNAVSSTFGMAALGSISAGFLGVAGWAIGVTPILLGQGRGLNSKVIDNPGIAFQEGVDHHVQKVRKLIWDPVHKMMVKE